MHIDWTKVERVLVVKLRSIGDTVLATPSLIALRRFLPNAQIDVLLEDWVAPLLVDWDVVHDAIDNVIPVPTRNSEKVEGGQLSAVELMFSRSIYAWTLRKTRYDVAFNLHGGTTGTFFTAASRAQHRVGYAVYQYSFLYNHLLSSASDFWHQEKTHSAEQQLALLGFVGVPVEDRPKSRLAVTDVALETLTAKFNAKTQRHLDEEINYALIHPTAAFATKQWDVENFTRVAEYLSDKGLTTIAIAAKRETRVLENLKNSSAVPVITFDDLTLPEITALASKAKLFVGNDSGIAHIAAAVQTPSVVIFGSSNRVHWRPWTDAPNEIVYEAFPCQPCPGYVCAQFGEPRCILSVRPESVFTAIDKVLDAENNGK